MLFIEYSKCSTCKRAKQFLDNNNIKYKDREIKEETPTYNELSKWIDMYNIDINKLFNTSGMLYREYKLKDKLNDLTKEEKIKLLSENALLIKRPLLIGNDFMYIGFKEKEWNNIK